MSRSYTPYFLYAFICLFLYLHLCLHISQSVYPPIDLRRECGIVFAHSGLRVGYLEQGQEEKHCISAATQADFRET
jgi:hypothetical protein